MRVLLADIASGEVDWADVFFLIAIILFVIAGVAHLTREALGRLSYALLCFGLALVALAWLLL